jgi:hypothetical protein
MVNLTWSDYTALWDKALAFKAKQGRLPNWVDHTGFRFYKADYQDAAKRVLIFMDKEGRKPNTVDVEGISLTAPSKPLFTLWYNSMIGAGYEGYNSDVYNSAEEDYNIAHHIAMNCTDYSQKAKEKAEALGYEWRFIHRICQSGKGHILGQIKGREFPDWTIIDVAAAASIGSKYPIGKSWCSNPLKEWISTEQWLMNNDGEFVK